METALARQKSHFNRSADRVNCGCGKFTDVRFIFYEESEALTDVHGSSDHADVFFGKPPITQVVNTIQASGCY